MCGLVALAVPGVQGQTPGAGEQKPAAPSTAAEKTSEGRQQKLVIGARARILPYRPFSVMDNGQVMNTTTVSKVNYDSNYNTVSHSFMLGGGLALEGRISPRTLVTADLLFSRLRYDKTTDVYWGTNDPTTAADERLRTTTNITYADATKGNNTIAAPVSKRLLMGGTVGVGLRFVDEFNIKVTPEVRYTRWNGTTFNQDSTRSPRNQLEVGIGFSR
jgi:hypothetical protein